MHICVYMRAQSLQLCPTLCDPMDHGPSGSSVHGILQARIKEWIAISFSIDKVWSEWSEVAQSCLTLCNPMDCSPPGSPAHGIFQAKVLEWVVIAFSRVYIYIYIYTYTYISCIISLQWTAKCISLNSGAKLLFVNQYLSIKLLNRKQDLGNTSL